MCGTCRPGIPYRSGRTVGVDRRCAVPVTSSSSGVEKYLNGMAGVALAAAFVAAVHITVAREVTAMTASGQQRCSSQEEAKELIEVQGQVLWLAGLPLG